MALLRVPQRPGAWRFAASAARAFATSPIHLAARRPLHPRTMSQTWNQGYFTDAAYTHGYYPELNRVHQRFTQLLKG